MQETLQLHLQDKQYRDILARYHFEEHDLERLSQVGSLVKEAAAPTMYHGTFVQEAANDGRRNGGLPSERLAVIVTLGGGVDELQNRYTQKERLTEGYMVECISMELLRIAYEQAADRIHAHTGKWMSGFEFVGDAIPFTYMKEIFRLLDPQEVSYNQAYMLTPKKTVVFLTDLCEERKDSYCHICANCTYLACPNRMIGNGHNPEELWGGRSTVESDVEVHGARIKQNLTYGYQRIFGERA